MHSRWFIFAAAWLVALGVPAAPPEQEPAPVRYRVEQTFRLETRSARKKPVPGRLQTEPVLSAVEGRVRLVLEQYRQEGSPLEGGWRFAEVEVENPRPEPADSDHRQTERVLALGLNWMQQLEGQEFKGPIEVLPVLPMGEGAPGWLTAWLRWAQTGNFSDVGQSSVAFSGALGNYDVRWVRSEFRRVPCHVQRARWTIPVQPAPVSLPPDLAAQGVQAHTHFAAESLEWVSQQNPTLIYAERSGVRETFWDLQNVDRPELRTLVFRLRFSVTVRVERLP